MDMLLIKCIPLDELGIMPKTDLFNALQCIRSWTFATTVIECFDLA